MKKILLALLLIAAASNVFAQADHMPALSIGLDAGLPTGTVSQVYGSVFGASAKLELPTTNSNLKFMFTAGYSSFQIKSEYNSIYTSASYGQLQAGARYYFIPVIYIEGDFGASFNLNSNYTEQKVGLAYDPVLGVNLPVSKSSAIDIGIRYDGRVESGGTISQVALRVAYKSYQIFAQSSTKEGSKFSIGINPALPLGNANNVYNCGLGGDLKFEQPVAANTFVSLSAGYTAFFTKSEFKYYLQSSYGFVPVKIGLKYYFNEGFFAEGQIGAVFATQSGGGTAFAYAPGIGYTFDSGFEAGFRFEGWSKDGSFNQLALRLAHRF